MSTTQSKIDRPANSIFRRVVVVGLATAAGAAAVVVGAGDSGAREAPPARTRVVRVAKVAAAPSHRSARFTSVVRAQQRAQLAFTLGGRLVRRPAEIGQRVKKGALLAQLDPKPLENAARAAEAQVQDIEARLAQLGRDVARAERLVAEKAGVPEQLEQVRAARDATQAGLSAARAQAAEARRMQREARLVAPFDGTVLEVPLEAGEMTSAGRPVVVLSAEASLEVEVHVPESVRAAIDPDGPVQVGLPMTDLPALDGRIAHLGRAAAGMGALFPVVVALPPNDAVVPGFTAEVSLPVRQPAAQLVPVPAVSDPGGHAPYVYRVKGDVAERVPVKVLGLSEAGVTVTSALRTGDAIVVAGHASLLPGEAVEVER